MNVEELIERLQETIKHRPTIAKAIVKCSEKTLEIDEDGDESTTVELVDADKLTVVDKSTEFSLVIN